MQVCFVSHLFYDLILVPFSSAVVAVAFFFALFVVCLIKYSVKYSEEKKSGRVSLVAAAPIAV